MRNKYLLFALFLNLVITTQAAPFRFVVAADGTGDYTSIQTALNACPDNERSIVFVKNGIYDEQVALGTKTTASKKLISLIGESYGGVIITHNQYRASSGSPTYEDICTVKLYANDFYAENITIRNLATAGMAEALYTAGDRQTFKNCQVLGYQDAYRAKKSARSYFKNSLLQGAVDFIYAGGTVFFDDCTINCIKGGGYIVAPEDCVKSVAATATTTGKALNLEFIFRNCNITANSDVADNSFTLGRPWNINSGAYYLNCKLGSHIKAAGWTTMGGNETTASFGEYNSLDINGNPVSTTGRISWSFQLAKSDVDNFLNPAYVYAQLSTTPYDPVSLCVSPSKPSISVSNRTISWSPVNDAVGYIIYKDNAYVGSTTATTYTDASATSGNYSVRSINVMGVLSDAGTAPSALSNIPMTDIKVTFNKQLITLNREVEKMQLFTVTGNMIAQNSNESSFDLNNLISGVYLLKINDKGLNFTKKLTFSAY
ncbi:MAG: pectinesterase family protein [Paludibacter sp.]|nr:pectinesterase family protein [Paludibacter sp.]